MRTVYISISIVYLSLLAGSVIEAAELHLQAGEKRILPVRKAQGLALDNPRIAETRIRNEREVELVGKGNGDGTLSIFTADGRTQTYSIHVRGGRSDAGDGDEEWNEVWPKVRFGGRRIPDAHCGEPAQAERTNQVFEEARGLLKKDQTQEAIPKLDQVLKIEPTAAFAHLFLGAAWAKLNDQAQGALHYETFVLSCPDDPKVEAVVRLLQEFDRRTPQGKPKP